MLTRIQISVLILVFDLIPVVFGISLWHRLRTDLRIFAVFFAISFTFDIILLYLAIHRGPNLDVLMSYALLEYAVLTYLYSQWELPRRLAMKLWASIVCLTLLVGVGLVTLEKVNFLHYLQIVESTLLIGLSIHALCKFLVSDQSDEKVYRFRISCGILVYFATYSLLFAITPMASTLELWVALLVASLIANFFYTGGFLSQHRLNIARSSSLEPGLSWL